MSELEDLIEIHKDMGKLLKRMAKGPVAAKEGKGKRGLTEVVTIGSVKIFKEIVDKLKKKENLSKKDVVSILMRSAGYKKNTANAKSKAYCDYLKETEGIEVLQSKRGRPKGSGSDKKKKRKKAIITLTPVETSDNTKIWKEILDVVGKNPTKKEIENALVNDAGYKRSSARSMSQGYMNYLEKKEKSPKSLTKSPPKKKNSPKKSKSDDSSNSDKKVAEKKPDEKKEAEKEE